MTYQPPRRAGPPPSRDRRVAGSAGCTRRAASATTRRSRSRSSTGATSTCSSRCSTRSRPARCRRARSPSRCAAMLRRQRNTTVILGEAVDLDVEGRRGHPVRRRADRLRLADRRHGRPPHVLRARRVGSRRAGPQDPRGRAWRSGERILIAFEAAEREADPDRRREWMTFVIVGGGPTGVELAGSLGEIARDTLRRDFRAINPADATDHPRRGDGSGPAALPARSLRVGAAPARAARRDGPARAPG